MTEAHQVASRTTADADDWPMRPLAFLVAGTLFMENLDATIVATAAPSIARSFGVTSSQIGITATAYLATVAALIPVSGWLAARRGARQTFLFAIALFTVASVLCSFSTNLTELSIMRVAQGAGGAMMVPVGRFVVLRATGKSNIIKAVAYLTWPALVAPVLAPAVGGLITSYATWPWIFLINLPLGIVALSVALRIMPRQARGDPGPLDWIGFVSTAISLGCLVVLAADLGSPTVSWLAVAVLAGVTVGVGTFAIVHLLRARSPLVRLDALRVKTFRAAAVGGTAFRVGINGAAFLLPLLFQDGFGWSPARAGSTLLFLFLGNLLIKPATTPLLRVAKFRTVLVATTTGATLTLVGCALLRPSTNVVLLIGVLALSGVFRSIGYTGYNTIAFADIDQASMSQANTLASTIQQLTQAFGVALAVISLKVGTGVVGHGNSFRFAFCVLGVAVFCALVAAIRLPVDSGDALRGGRKA
jgi:EmrB/QacA subfamily drug resistance transporter